MIIWLASYPKSGNTLLRSILATYFFSEDGNFNFNHLYKIGQFPNVNSFLRLGLDVSNENKIFENYIKVQSEVINSDKSLFFSAEASENDNFNTFGYKTNKTGVRIGTNFEYLNDFYLGINNSNFYEKIETNSTASAMHR